MIRAPIIAGLIALALALPASADVRHGDYDAIAITRDVHFALMNWMDYLRNVERQRMPKTKRQKRYDR